MQGRFFVFTQMKNLFLLLSICISSFVFAQSGEIRGTIKDAGTGETVVGASVVVAEGKNAVTDIDGNFSIKVDPGEYTVTVSYVGFEGQKQKVKVGDKPVKLSFSLQTTTLNEVE